MEELFLEYENIAFVACNDKTKLINGLINMDISITAYDYDPKFVGVPNYKVNDFVFDNIDFNYECVVNWNCEKTYPLGLLYKGDMILIGDNKKHNGDCNPIESCEQLILQNKINTVYSMFEKNNHYVVHGSNIS